MYAGEIIFIPRKTYASDEKTVPQPSIHHNSSINDKSSQHNYLQRFREKNTSSDSQPLLNRTSIPLTPNFVLPNPQKRSLSALSKFSEDGDDEAEKDLESNNSLQQTSSKGKEKYDEKMKKPLK